VTVSRIARLLLFILVLAPATAAATERQDAIRVFLDCSVCDLNYIRTEVTFVNYVRDRTAADVHVLITSQGTGGGGIQYTLQFIGLGRFKGVDNLLTHAAPQGATQDQRRRGLVSIFKLGLVRYVTETPLASLLSLQFEDTPEQAPAPVRDPWNFWVFRASGTGGVDGEQATSLRTVSANLSANRTTEMWKLIFSAFGNHRSQRFVLASGETFTSLRRNYDGRGLVTRSLSPHWSVGATGAISSSTFTNYDLRTRIGPGIEYNVFPYAESNHRLLTLYYTTGIQTAAYKEETIYGKLEETLVDHQFELSMGLRQPWGTATAAFETSHYLNREAAYRVSAFGGMDVRLFKGFSVSMDGRLARRRDQLSLRRGAASTEEILVRQRELATDYSYDFRVGLSYSFGSIFNSVVNPRFRGAGGF
jgi:hypothetical protein